jgi:hypothetical protein
MVVFLAVVVSFDDLHDVVQAGQALAEWFHALEVSARDPLSLKISGDSGQPFAGAGRPSR